YTLMLHSSTISFSSLRLPPCCTLFPYTTLFRSLGAEHHDEHEPVEPAEQEPGPRPERLLGVHGEGAARGAGARHLREHPHDEDRSEEHTSELQSRENLVCRLLLEKKKQKT